MHSVLIVPSASLISYFQAVILGLTQGIAEPFPISSLGHGVVLPRLAGWHIHQNDKFFLTFLVATHLGTALVLLGFFFKDWVRIVKGLWRSLAIREIRADDVDARLAWLLVGGDDPRRGSSACCWRRHCANCSPRRSWRRSS